MSEEKKRSKYDIYAEIIEVVARRSDCSLTRVSYGANLSVGRAKKTLDVLAAHGFVEKTAAGEAPKYRATKWGLGFLETYRRMRKFLAALEQPLKMSPSESVLPDRVPTGHEALDNLLFGGIPENYTVILASPSCDERQLLVKSYLETGLRNNNIVFDVTTDASGFKNLVDDFQSSFYLFVCNPQADEMVESKPNVFKLKGVANLNDINIALTLALRQLNTASKSQKRACIEIVSDVLLQHRALDTRRWLSMLLPELKSNGFTTLATVNPYMHAPEETQAIVDLFEGEISIFERGSTEGVEKLLKVRKLYNQKYLEFEIPLSKEKPS